MTSLPTDILNILLLLCPEAFYGTNNEYTYVVEELLRKYFALHSFDEIAQDNNAFFISQAHKTYMIDPSDVKVHESGDHPEYPILRKKTLRLLSVDSLAVIYKLRNKLSLEVINNCNDTVYDDTCPETIHKLVMKICVAYLPYRKLLHSLIQEDTRNEVLSYALTSTDESLVLELIQKYPTQVLCSAIIPVSIKVFDALVTISYDFSRNSKFCDAAIDNEDIPLFRALLRWKGKKGKQVKVSKFKRVRNDLYTVLLEERPGINFKNYFH